MARLDVLARESIFFDGLRIIVLYKHNKYMRLHVRKAFHKEALEEGLDENMGASALSQPYIMLSAPIATKPAAINNFLIAQREWLHMACAHITRATQESQNLLHDKANKILLFGEWVEAMPLVMLHAHLCAYLMPRAQELATTMGLRFSKIAVRPSRTRFGSCTGDRLSFSILLAFAYKEEIDYVIIHELAHIVHKNHSARFWELVEAYCANWKILRKRLKSRYGVYSALLDRLASA